MADLHIRGSMRGSELEGFLIHTNPTLVRDVLVNFSSRHPSGLQKMVSEVPDPPRCLRSETA